MFNHKISDYVALAEASYADFSTAYKYNEEAKKFMYDKKNVKLSLTELGKPGMVGKVINTVTFNSEDNGKSTTEQFAEYLTDKYEVAAHWKDRGDFFTSADKDQSSGFSGTLFKSKISEQYVLALRGTKIGQQQSAGCFSDVPSVKSSLHFINGAES